MLLIRSISTANVKNDGMVDRPAGNSGDKNTQLLPYNVCPGGRVTLQMSTLDRP